MEFSRAYELMDIELQCVRRNSTGICDRKCEKCDLVRKDTDLIEAYQMAKFALSYFFPRVKEFVRISEEDLEESLKRNEKLWSEAAEELKEKRINTLNQEIKELERWIDKNGSSNMDNSSL